MPRLKNSVFRFKQFEIQQGQTAMKVCTDACVLGAWADVLLASKILDIGTGTGLLALMLAQRSNAPIHAVEIDSQAFTQAENNVKQSPFANKISVYHQSIQTFVQQAESRSFSHIVVNPPFFEQHLPSTDQQRNAALHTQTLSFEDLILAIDQLLSPSGQCFVLLPFVQSQRFVKLASTKNLFVNQQLLIKHQENKPILRVITVFQKQAIDTIKTETLHIKNPSQTYSSQFSTLLKDYYLIF